MLVYILTGVDIDPPVTARLSDVETAVTIAPVNVCKVSSSYNEGTLVGSVNKVIYTFVWMGGAGCVCVCVWIPATHCLYSNHSNSHP